VQAGLVLRTPNPSQKVLTPAQTQAMVETLLRRLQQETGASPRDDNVFKHLGSFVVAASTTFSRNLLEEGEIASAMANRQPEERACLRATKDPGDFVVCGGRYRGTGATRTY
jgi:hypothetical protein